MAFLTKLLSNVTVNAPEVITAAVRAHDRAGHSRLEHLYEAQRRCLDMLSEIQSAIRVETAQCGEAAVPRIAARIRAVADMGSKLWELHS